jgi:NADP-dependent 3-hydroxy acid dehydrogenase YdfG
MKRVIVMGATSGLGRETALLLAAKGHLVGCAGRRADRLQELADKYPGKITTEVIDITDDSAEEHLLSLIEKTGGMDLYFHASGIGKQNLILEANTELNTVATNGMGFTRMVGAAYRYMAAHGGGHIAVISSIAGTKGLGPAPSYSATKAFQNTYIQALEQQANSRSLNIRFTDIRPGFVDTDLLNGGSGYPLLLKKENVAREIVKAIEHRQHKRTIDWRWRLITAGWRCVPNFIWRRLRLSAGQHDSEIKTR